MLGPGGRRLGRPLARCQRAWAAPAVSLSAEEEAAAGDATAAGAAEPVTAPAGPVVERQRQVLEPMIALRAKVVRGFGRGSKLLGFPTANMEVNWEADFEDISESERAIREFADTCVAGIYYGWAQVPDGPDPGVYKTALSVGWNPTFTDVKVKTIEPWILHDYHEDFYGCELRLLICGLVRPELKFDNFDDLIAAIREDGEFCSAALDDDACVDAKLGSTGTFFDARPPEP